MDKSVVVLWIGDKTLYLRNGGINVLFSMTIYFPFKFCGTLFLIGLGGVGQAFLDV